MSSEAKAGLDRILLAVASSFQRSPQPAVRQSWELPALLVVVVLATVVRLWGLGSWGLEGDEKTMALPTMHIVKYGDPVFPSGMTYVRGIGQLYLMAASVKAFGESEWAFRLPSVLCGLALIVIAFFLGKRFLDPICNIAQVAAVAFLPGFIADSQEARMYIFMLTCLAGYAVLVFEWEKTNSLRFLVAAVCAMIVGLQFHVLSVFGAFLVFLPGLLKGDARKLWQALAAFCCIAVAYFAISRWVQSYYPPRLATHGIRVVIQEYASRVSGARAPSVISLVAATVGIALSVYVAGAMRSGRERLLVGVFVLLGLAAQLAFWNHIGLLLLIGVAVYMSRSGDARLSRLFPLALISLLILAFEYRSLAAAGIGTSRKVLGAMVGLPSVWPTLRLTEYSPGATLIVAIGLARAVWQLARGRRIPDYWLFFLLAAWAPLLLLGLFSWDVETRYTEFAILPILICAFALFQGIGSGRSTRVAVAASICLAVVNPLASARVINAGYSIHPDHKGAAEFVRSIGLKPGDLVLAEDVLQQTYYLGHVDYWLIGPDTAEEFSQRVNGELRDIYTAVPVLCTVEQLDALLRRPDRGTIYLIGSGEQQRDLRRAARGSSLDDALHSALWEVVYSGRDGLTKVWKAPSPQDGPLPAPGQ